ncbi:MAG: hypothetical protein HC933_04560 [Pleurocapsa sp. SU_196_0]|nr:hypothetical protein [Pleurocapsa sp. SU_196_0]
MLLLISTSVVLGQGVSSRPLVIRVLLAQQSRATVTVATAHTASYQDGVVLTRSTQALEYRVQVTPSGKIGVETAQVCSTRDASSSICKPIPRGTFNSLARSTGVPRSSVLEVRDWSSSTPWTWRITCAACYRVKCRPIGRTKP